MIAERLISRLDSVRETGPDRWLACCPSHDDKSPSLSIRETDDRLLIHCWAGCTAQEVVSAAGLELSDLFPEPIKLEGNKPLSRPFPAADILRALHSEIYFLVVCASDIEKGEKLDEKTKTRLMESAALFREALSC